MGSEESRPREPQVTHDQIISIINASNAKAKEHSEKTATSTELIAFVLLAVVIIGVVFLVYKIISNYERMRTQARIEHAASLNNGRSSTVWTRSELVK